MCITSLTCFSHGQIMRQWALGHRQVKRPPPLLHKSKTTRLKEAQNTVFQKICLCSGFLSLCSRFASLCSHYMSFCGRFVVVLCLQFLVILHLFLVVLRVILHTEVLIPTRSPTYSGWGAPGVVN